MADRSDLMIKFDNHSPAMTRIENCQKVCCSIRVFVLLLEPVAFIVLFPSSRLFYVGVTLALASSVTRKQFVLPENNLSYATISLKNQQCYGKRPTKTTFAGNHKEAHLV